MVWIGGEDSWDKTLFDDFILRVSAIGTKSITIHGFPSMVETDSHYGKGHFRKGNERVSD